MASIYDYAKLALKNTAKYGIKAASKVALPATIAYELLKPTKLTDDAKYLLGNTAQAAELDEYGNSILEKQLAANHALYQNATTSTGSSSKNTSSSSKSSGVSYGSSGGANSVANNILKNDPYKDLKKIADKQKEAEEERLKQMKKSYNTRYDQLSEMIESRRPQAEADRNAAIESINAELANLIQKGEISKQDTNAYYDQSKSELQTAHENSVKELSRIFQSRNATDSSYFMEKLQQSQSQFEKTLANLGGEQARQIAKLDADMTYYQQQSISKKAEIEKAYNETIRAINEDLTKTSWEKEDAINQLDSEFSNKMSAIDDRILQYSLQQQQFRAEVEKWAYDQSFKEKQWAADYALDEANKNASYKTSGGDDIYEVLSQSKGTDGYTDPDVYARLRSYSNMSADQFNKKYSYMLSNDSKKRLGLTTGSAISDLDFENL